MEDITDADCKHAKRVWKKFRMKNLSEYHDLDSQNDTFLLANAFENLWSKCLEIHKPDTAHFRSVPGLAWQAALKNKSKIRTIN